MRTIRSMICGMLLSTASAWSLENQLGVYFAGSEVSYSELDVAGSAPLYEAGISYALSMKYFKASASAGVGQFRTNPSFTAGMVAGPKVTLLARKLDVGLGMGLGYLGYYKYVETAPGILTKEFTSDQPVLVSLDAALFDRLDASLEGHWNSDSWWRLKLGARVLSF